MEELIKCPGTDCEINGQCHRYTAPQKLHEQSWIFPPSFSKDIEKPGDCPSFIESTPAPPPEPPSATLGEAHGRKLQELSTMKDGWYDGWDGIKGSKAPTKAALDATHALLSKIHIVPLMDGGVQLEVHTPELDVEVEIDDQGKLDNFWVSKG